MKTYNDKPIFLLNVDDEDATITTISLVDEPAMELPMFCFEKESKLSFSLQDELKHNIITCIVRTDYPILRMTEDGNPYYVVFNKETSEKLCQKLLKDGFQQNISLDHNGQLIDGISLQEVFLKDSSKGISPVGFDEAAEGSLFGIYHITDENLWNECVEGRFGGVSLESYFKLEQFNKINNNKKTIMSKIKDMLKNILMEFNNLSTDKAELYWEEDTELAVGYKVFVDQDGNKIPAADGEYISDANKIKVEGGIVTEIEKKEPEDDKKEPLPVDPASQPEEKKEEMACGDKKNMEEAPVEEVKEEVKEEEKPEEEKKEEDKAVEFEKRIAELEAKIEELIVRIAEISAAPAAEPVVEEFEKVTKTVSTGDKKLDKRIALASALREN